MENGYRKYFEYFEIGEVTKCGGRQMTEADTRLSVGVIGGSHPLHMDPTYCANATRCWFTHRARLGRSWVH